MPLFKATFYGLSDVGLVRESNEDLWKVLPQGNCFILADGMGGHLAGEVAAKEAVSSLVHAFTYHKQQIDSLEHPQEVAEFLYKAVEQANRTVHFLATNYKKYRGMGTTLCCAYLYRDCLVYAHVGDSRLYRFRNGKLKQLTKDHSLIDDLATLSDLEEADFQPFRFKHILTRAVGIAPEVQPSVGMKKIASNDVYLLCSDGLSDYVMQHQLENILKESFDLESAAIRMIDKAKNRGGKDNITVILLKTEPIYETADLSG